MDKLLGRALVTVVSAALCGALWAAAPMSGAEKAAEAMLKVDTMLQKATAQMDAVIASLNGLGAAQGSDLVAKFKEYSKQVDTLDKLQKSVAKEGEAAAKQREQYLADWQKAQDKIQSPDLKAAAEARRSELLPAIEELKANLATAREHFNPMMQNLKDLQLFLGADLTAGGLAAAQPLIAKCSEASTVVKSDIESGTAALRNLSARIKPGGATEPAPAGK
jgi:hypothetical protein